MATDLSAFTVYVSPQLLATIKARAAADGRSLSNFVQRHLEASFGGKQITRVFRHNVPEDLQSRQTADKSAQGDMSAFDRFGAVYDGRFNRDELYDRKVLR